jgi:hypothetical protein
LILFKQMDARLLLFKIRQSLRDEGVKGTLQRVFRLLHNEKRAEERVIGGGIVERARLITRSVLMGVGADSIGALSRDGTAFIPV